MDIFVRHLPVQATRKQIEDQFREPLRECGITAYHVEKMRDKPLATITVLDVNCGEHFVSLYGVPPNSPYRIRAKKPLCWGGKYLQLCKSRTDPGDLSVRCLALESSQRAAKSLTNHTSRNAQNQKITRFAVHSLRCGSWDYSDNRLCFVNHWSQPGQQGSISFGLKEAVILLGTQDGGQCRVNINYHECSNIVLGNYSDPAISFTLSCAPKFYRVPGEDLIAAALLAMTLGSNAAKQQAPKKARLPNLDDAHAKVAGSCFVYRITLSHYNMMSNVRNLIDLNVKIRSSLVQPTTVLQPPEMLEKSFTRLNHELTDHGRYGTKPFPLLYQLTRLAWNGVLSPLKVIELLPKIFNIYEDHGLDATLSTLHRASRKIPVPGPDTEAVEFSKPSLEKLLEEHAADYEKHRYSPENAYELTRRHTHINLIHKLIVTPTGTHLDGPNPEPTNRVLRRYSGHIDLFCRVVFQDEDGSSVRYDPQSNLDAIYHDRFKGVLDGGVLIAGRMLSFLGFSHSSLRSQSCWFMAPLFSQGMLKLPHHVLQELGDFSNIRVPAKCAARIGQNFTDTNATVDLLQENVGQLPLVERNGYDFSDGCGTISKKLLRRVWRVYGRRRQMKPSVLQLRFGGSKGVVSLDSRLTGEQLMLRSNMNKFYAPNATNLEICGAAFRPLPMILNRQLIKILEDLDIGADIFMNLQNEAVKRLQELSQSPFNASTFLENEMECTRATKVSSLIRQLGQIGLDYRQDEFLYGVVEMAVVTKLRDIKYRGRIPVKAGVTLYGIMDETGFLQEGQIYAVREETPEGGRQILVSDRIAITRSPAMHPGDVQIVEAVNVPDDSPLRELSNVVVFSQHGGRDLASQLSGGDLDGDLYNVIWDPNLVPGRTSEAAQYPRNTAAELDRTIGAKDMSDFFVTFMESDLLGMISNVHMQLADQREYGTFDLACTKLASMASTAVDFSKTGIAVNMRECPKYPRCRPDFMARSPRIIVSEKGFLEFEHEEDDEDPAFAGLDAERRSFRHYESPKVLGQLYRAIDERKFLNKMQQDRQTIASARASRHLLDTLLGYMKRLASQYGILFIHHRDLAADIRAGYDDSLLDILYCYGPTPYAPVSEHEAFAGTILGRQGGAQGKPLRELSKTMRERFEAVVEYTIMRIVKGDEQMKDVGDLDILYDDGLDREVEALPRAIASLDVAMNQRGTTDQRLGERESFRYIAAAVCLRELERFSITTLGCYSLPMACDKEKCLIAAW